MCASSRLGAAWTGTNAAPDPMTVGPELLATQPELLRVLRALSCPLSATRASVSSKWSRPGWLPLCSWRPRSPGWWAADPTWDRLAEHLRELRGTTCWGFYTRNWRVWTAKSRSGRRTGSSWTCAASVVPRGVSAGLGRPRCLPASPSAGGDPGGRTVHRWRRQPAGRQRPTSGRLVWQTPRRTDAHARRLPIRAGRRRSAQKGGRSGLACTPCPRNDGRTPAESNKAARGATGMAGNNLAGRRDPTIPQPTRTTGATPGKARRGPGLVCGLCRLGSATQPLDEPPGAVREMGLRRRPYSQSV